ncbi:MAG: chemotaxis protein CheW [Solirubrobacterales bacterium]
MEILTFKLGDEPFGISISLVEAIEHMVPITYVPKARSHIAGLINIRGNIVPAIDLSKLFKLSREIENAKLILIRYDNQELGLMVDEVEDVIEINEDDIESISQEAGEFSIINYGDRVITYISEKQINLI